MALRIDTSNLVIIQAQSSHVCMNRVKIDYANVPTQNGYKKAVLVLVSLLFLKTASYFYGEQGWHSFETIPLSSIFKSRHPRHFLVEFVVGFLLCYQGFFSGCSCFPQKPTFPGSTSTRNVDLLPLETLFTIYHNYDASPFSFAVTACVRKAKKTR